MQECDVNRFITSESHYLFNYYLMQSIFPRNSLVQVLKPNCNFYHTGMRVIADRQIGLKIGSQIVMACLPFGNPWC